MRVGSVYDPVAQVYDATRPDHPAEVYDAIERAMGQPLLWADVLDVGAGTGVSARAMAGRGARVVAVDVGEEMLRVCRSRSGRRVRPVLGDAAALPLRGGSVDAVTFAQSWHWTDPAASTAEALRVLRPGGVLAMWWSASEVSAATWLGEWSSAVRAVAPVRHDIRGPAYGEQLAAVADGRPVAAVEVPWVRGAPAATLVEELRSHSWAVPLEQEDPAALERLLGRLHVLLRQAHPRDPVPVPYLTRLWMVRR